MEINVALKKIKAKYLKDKEFKKEFNKDKEKAIEKHFGKNILKDLKTNFGNSISQINTKYFLSNNEELDDRSLESIAGGKDKKPKNQTKVVVIEDQYKQTDFNLDLKNTRTGGNVNLIDNSTLRKI